MLNGLGLSLSRRNFHLTTASGTVYMELVKQGLGISVLTRDSAALIPGLEPVLPELDPFPVPVWLVTHRELHTSRRIRLVFDFLAEALSSEIQRLHEGEAVRQGSRAVEAAR